MTNSLVDRLRNEQVEQSSRCGEEDSQDRALLAEEAANEIERLQKREDQLMGFLRSFISGGVNQDFKPWARELYQKLYSSHEPFEPRAVQCISGEVVWFCVTCCEANCGYLHTCAHCNAPRPSDS